jgi:GTP pyrophosphokinase
MTGSAMMADVIREMGFRKAEDFYVAVGAAKVSPKTVVNKLMQRLKQGEAAVEEPSAADLLHHPRRERAQKATKSSSTYGIRVEGIEDVPLRLAKCCRPVSGDPIVGYVSLGRGITIHRDDCPNAIALRKDPERFVDVSWDGENETSFKVELQVDGWDRHRLLEDLSRTFAEAGINILEARCIVSHPMTKNRFVVEVPEAATLKSVITRLRQIDAVFDAYRVTPTGGG